MKPSQATIRIIAVTEVPVAIGIETVKTSP